MVVKLYHPYTEFTRNVHLPHRRIVTFLIIEPYKYSDLLTDEFLVNKYLWQFCGKRAKTTWCEIIFITLRML